MQNEQQVSFVVGGTGMLANAARWLAARSARTYLVARRASRFAPEDATILPVDADWNHPSFPGALQTLLRAPPTVTHALLWLHEPEPVLPWLLPLLEKARVILVLGSMDGRPKLPPGAAQIVTVRLGSMRTPSGRRWLTDEEISNGAIEALEDGRSRIVGELAAR